jgi:casein kinase I family protein HRR25
MGVDKSSSVINVIDFGLAKKFRDPRTTMHIPYQQDEQHRVGTSLFASIHTHNSIGKPNHPPHRFSRCPNTLVECSRRDDLESLAYMLIYFIRGNLPWRRLHGETVAETWDIIRDKKLETEQLLTVGLPEEFDIFYKYTRSLDFDDLPDYEGLRNLFRGLAAKHGIEYDSNLIGLAGGRRRRGNAIVPRVMPNISRLDTRALTNHANRWLYAI